MNMQLMTTQAKLMSTREIAELIEKQHSNIKISAERLAASGVIGTLAPQEFTHNGNIYTEYLLCKRDTLILVAQNCPEFTARIVDRWQELENSIPKFDPATLTRIDILKLAMESEEARLKAETERDQAIATKAQIGSKREATAMARVAVANKEVARLKDQLGFSVRQATILQVEDAMGNDFDFLPLRRWCNANEIVAESVPDKRYPKGVKAWPAAAWKACYGIDLASIITVPHQ
jgi:phage regulator Rha-like protein